MTGPNEQLKEEIKKKVFPALDAVLGKESTTDDFTSTRGAKEIFRIDKDDKQTFLDAITIKKTECIEHTNFYSLKHDETNHTSEAHQFPGQATRHGERGARGGEVHANVDNPTAGIGAHASFVHETEEHFEEHFEDAPSSVPAHSTRTRRQSTSVRAHKLYLVVQADCAIRVYSHTPVKAGASIGGGVGIVAGAAGGAAVGSIVPVAGHIVGGIVGAIVGVVAGGTTGAGVGAGSGALHSNRVHMKVRAREVFAKFPDFSHDEKNNICHCTIIVNTTCRTEYQKITPSGGD